MLLFAALLISLGSPAMADSGSASQHRAAEEFLAAVASGDAQAIAHAIHPDNLDLLRKRLLDEMRLESDRRENIIRGRLFGVGMPLADLERLTSLDFFAALAGRLQPGGRSFERVEWLAAVPDSGGMVQLVGRGQPPKDHGTVRVPVLVSLVPWGKDWKAAVPLELQAKLEDLVSGRVQVQAAGRIAPTDANSTDTAPGNPQAINALLTEAEQNLVAVRCEDYYTRQMSPNFRRTISTKALRSLITTCESRPEIRERLLIALRVARDLQPRYDYAGTRAVYDLRGQGLPFAQLQLEQIDKHWYIAE
ncbi:MAG: hypothetical protein ABI616_13970 [Pseudomonadota bacterium]